MRGRVTLLLLVVGVVVLVATGALLANRGTGGDATGSAGVTGGASIDTPGSEPADPVIALDTALAGGKPAYILIHSLTWVSCTELAAVAATTMPDYEGRVVFVDAITDSSSAEPILQRYPTQYIPTSVFIDSDGGVVDTVIGPLSEADLRERLDALALRSE